MLTIYTAHRRRRPNPHGGARADRLATIYCPPCLVLLMLGMAFREQVRGRLHSIFTRFSTGTIKKSVPMAVLLVLTAIGVGSIAAYP